MYRGGRGKLYSAEEWYMIREMHRNGMIQPVDEMENIVKVPSI